MVDGVILSQLCVHYHLQPAQLQRSTIHTITLIHGPLILHGVVHSIIVTSTLKYYLDALAYREAMPIVSQGSNDVQSFCFPGFFLRKLYQLNDNNNYPTDSMKDDRFCMEIESACTKDSCNWRNPILRQWKWLMWLWMITIKMCRSWRTLSGQETGELTYG